MIKLILVVGAGGFIGANMRYWASYLIAQRSGGVFPYGTLLVNVVGCLALGFLLSYSAKEGGLSPDVRLFVGTGILGALTTFSTFSVETLQLLGESGPATAGLNVVANVAVGLLAAWGGTALARALS